MKKILLVTGAAFLAITGHAQFNQSQLRTAQSTGEKAFAPGQSAPQGVTTLVNDTLHYFFNKHYYKNDTVGNANTSFPTLFHPHYNLGDSISHMGSLFMNSGTVTVHGLEGLVMKEASSVSQNVPVRLYLHYLNNVTMLPIMPPIDSVTANVSSSTGGVWAGGNFVSPKTVTNNFAVTYRCASTIAGDTLRLFINNAHTSTSTATGVKKFSDGWGVLRYLGNWQSNNDAFGPGTGYEFVVAPRVSLSYQSSITVTSPTICNNSVGSFVNSSTPMFHLEHRQWNFNKFAAYWGNYLTNYEFLPPTDSTWNWTFTNGTPPATNAKNPSILFTNAGTQTASLAVSYWYSVNAGFWIPPPMDGSSKTIFVDASSSPTISVTGNTNICSGQTTTLSLSGNPTFTWNTTPPSNSNSMVVTPNTTTQYTVLANNGGCTALKVITVQVSPAPNVTISGPNSSCVGKAFTLTASGASNYLWSNTNQTQAITVSSSTAGTVSYTVVGSAGSCPQDTAVHTVLVNANPVVALSAGAGTICSKATGGTTLALTGTPAGGLYSGTGVVGNVFTANASGTVPVTYTYLDPSTQCSANALTNVVVKTCVVGITEQQASNVLVFPNPSNDGIIFLQNVGDINRLSVVNILGQQLRSEAVNGDHRLDLSSLPAGQYFIMLSNTQGVVQTVKIVNQN